MRLCPDFGVLDNTPQESDFLWRTPILFIGNIS